MTGDPESHPTVWWLAEREGRPVGCAPCRRTRSLSGVAVHEPGRGLADALVRESLAQLTRLGVKRLRLEVGAANTTGNVRPDERLTVGVGRGETVWASSR